MGITPRYAVLVGLAVGCAWLAFQVGCKPEPPPSTGAPVARAAEPPATAPGAPKEDSAVAWKLTSTAFTDGARLPTKYTQDGAGVSPPLAWTACPAATQELVLICDDPDAPAGTFTHWIVYGLDPTVTNLPEAIPTTPEVAEPFLKQGMNSGHHTGYLGPGPPPGKVHNYHFQLYAVSGKLNLLPSLSKQELLAAMEGKIANQTELVGTYSR
jgi:Raf kinase inhibitor-like YbhB/YbcL family protein